MLGDGAIKLEVIEVLDSDDETHSLTFDDEAYHSDEAPPKMFSHATANRNQKRMYEDQLNNWELNPKTQQCATSAMPSPPIRLTDSHTLNTASDMNQPSTSDRAWNAGQSSTSTQTKRNCSLLYFADKQNEN